ncbi:serine protease, partial [Mesorhizobium sp. M2D.F.Ca.ET.145.01.1.1]
MHITNRFGQVVAASLLGIATAVAFINAGQADEAAVRPEAVVS